MKRLPYLRKMKVVPALLEKFHFSEHLKISEFREGGAVVSRAQLFSRINRWRDLPARKKFRLAGTGLENLNFGMTKSYNQQVKLSELVYLSAFPKICPEVKS